MRHSGTSRREFLTVSAAAGLQGFLSARGLNAQTRPPAASSATVRIDVHHHIVPPPLIQAIGAQRLGAASANWTPMRALEELEQGGVSTGISSIAPAGDPFNDSSTAVRLCRQCNEYAARLAADHPRRFGVFASLPLPNVDGSLKEIEYAFDTLKADGVGLFTSYGDKYLGDPSFEPVYAELNRRKAVVYVHPTTPDCCGKVVPGIGPSTIEFATDTTRTVTHIVFSGVATKFPDIRSMFSHAGGTLPFLTARLEIVAQQKKMAGGAAPILRKFYYELAQGNTP